MFFCFFFVVFTEGNNNCDFLFAYLDEEALVKWGLFLTLLHSERPKLHRVLAFLSAIGLKENICFKRSGFFCFVLFFCLLALISIWKGGKR